MSDAILHYPDEPLSTECKPIPDEWFDDEENKQYLKELEDLLIEECKKGEGIGLAANQIGIERRAFAMMRNDRRFYVVFNPEITDKSESTLNLKEGCLSLPGYQSNVSRSECVNLIGVDVEGNPIEWQLNGLEAAIAQHELDHINGYMFFDNLPKFRYRKFMDRLRKGQNG